MSNRHWRRYVRFWGPDVDADVDDEVRFHLEMKAAELAARGLPPDEALREARRRFGPVDDVRRWLRRSSATVDADVVATTSCSCGTTMMYCVDG